MHVSVHQTPFLKYAKGQRTKRCELLVLGHQSTKGGHPGGVVVVVSGIQRRDEDKGACTGEGRGARAEGRTEPLRERKSWEPSSLEPASRNVTVYDLGFARTHYPAILSLVSSPIRTLFFLERRSHPSEILQPSLLVLTRPSAFFSNPSTSSSSLPDPAPGWLLPRISVGSLHWADSG